MLIQKGISKDLIEEIYEEEIEPDDTAIIRAIQKKTKDVDALSYEEKQKIAASLYRKGFASDEIRKYLF